MGHCTMAMSCYQHCPFISLYEIIFVYKPKIPALCAEEQSEVMVVFQLVFDALCPLEDDVLLLLAY